MTIFYTSDSHHGHRSILNLCNRPYASVEEMDESLIANWNSVVQPTDDVWMLGDFAYRQKKGSLGAIFGRLNGTKRLIIGNHDNDEVIELPWAAMPTHYEEIKQDGTKIVLCHYPMRSWNGMYRGALHLYGHEHGNIPDYATCADVGVDCWNFFPATLAQIKDRMATMRPNPIIEAAQNRDRNKVALPT